MRRKRRKRALSEMQVGLNLSKELAEDVAVAQARVFEPLDAFLAPLELERDEVLRDGNCLFHAVIKQWSKLGIELPFTPDADSLRTRVVNHLRRSPELFANYFSHENVALHGDFSSYLEHMEISGEWCDELCLIGLVDRFKAPIVLFKTDCAIAGKQWNPVSGAECDYPAIQLCLAEQFHFDAVKAVGSDVVVPPRKCKRKPAAAAPLVAYGADAWRGFGDNRNTRKYTCAETDIAEGEKESFFRAAMDPIPAGGVLATAILETTCTRHWDVFRRYVNWLITDFKAPDTAWPVTVADVLRKDLLQDYFNSLRGSQLAASTAKSIFHSFCVVIEVMVKHLEARKLERGSKARKKQMRAANNLSKFVRRIGKNLCQWLAGEGAKPPPIGSMDNRKDPLTLKQMLKNRIKYIRSSRRLKRKISKCTGDVSYMRFRLARRRAALVANDFLMESCARIGTVRRFVFARTLKYRSDQERLCFSQQGTASSVGKSVRNHRLRRGLKDLRITFSFRTSRRATRFIVRDLQVLNAYVCPGEAPWKDVDRNLNPPNREGEDCFSLFSGWCADPSAFRRLVQQVTKTTSDELRGAVIDVMKVSCVQHGFHPDAIQFFAGKAREIQIKHYGELQSEGFQEFRNGILGF